MENIQAYCIGLKVGRQDLFQALLWTYYKTFGELLKLSWLHFFPLNEDMYLFTNLLRLSLSKYLLQTYYMPSIILVTKNATVNIKTSVFPSVYMQSRWEKDIN